MDGIEFSSRKTEGSLNHESLDREEVIDGSSDRSFGLVFATVFAVVAAWPLLSGRTMRWWALAIAVLFAVTALVRPQLLARLNVLWTRLGVLLGKVVSPIALGVLFYLVITPIGIMLRLAGKDPLRLKPQPTARTHWLPARPRGRRPTQ